MLGLISSAVMCTAASWGVDGGAPGNADPVPSSVWLDGPAVRREPLPTDPPAGPDRRFLQAAASDGGVPGPRPIHPYAEGTLAPLLADAGPAYVVIPPVGEAERADGGEFGLSLPRLLLALPLGPELDVVQAPVPTTSLTTGLPTPVTQLGRTHHALTGDEILRSGGTVGSDVVGRLPGVWLTRSAVAVGAPVIRGLGAGRVGVLVDGFRLNNATWGDGWMPYLATVDGWGLESAELVPSADGAWAGDGAMGGVLALTSRSAEHGADLTVHALAAGFYQSADQGRGLRLHLAGGMGPASASVAATLEDHQDVRAGRGEGVQERTGYVPMHVSARARAVFLRQQVDAGYDAARVTHLPLGTRCRPRRAGEPIYDCTLYDELNRDLAFARLTVRPRFFEELQVGVAWQRQWQTLSRVDFYSLVIDRMQDDVNMLQAQARGSTPLWALGPVATRFALGTDAQHDMVQSRFWRTQMRGELGEVPGLGTRLPTRSRLPDGSTHTSLSLHGTLETWLFQALVLRVAARAAVHRASLPAADRDPNGFSRVYVEPTASAQLLFLLGDRGFVAASLLHGYHAPGLLDLSGRTISDVGFEYSRPQHVRPESALTADSTVRVRAGRMALQASLYATRWNGAPERVASRYEEQDFVDGLPVYERRSGGDAVLLGGDAWADARLVSHLHVGGWFSLVLAQRLRSSQALPGHPPPFGALHISYVAPLGFYGTAQCRMALPARRLADIDRLSPAYDPTGTPQSFIFHAGAGYQITARSGVDLLVENILDEPYRLHGSATWQPGVNARAQVRVGF
ncbi:MAG: TonB-dependent receptor plug domain-containing protein [Deltaproteobacteria bacterium]|nr:TonB-dependent receptor plug domain-containing protein [Deltaproteobacteria bacterium]